MIKKTIFTVAILLKVVFCIGQTTELQDSLKSKSDWTFYEIEDVGQIAIPPTMELRDKDSMISQLYDSLYLFYNNILKIKFDKPQIVFQPNVMNSFKKEANPRYSRIIINYQKGQKGDYNKYNHVFNFTQKKKNEIDKGIKEKTVSEMPAMDVKLIKWNPVEFGNINGLTYIKVSFIRKMNDNPEVYVEQYNFFNYDEIVEIIISYRLIERDIWESDFSKIINTFDFKTRK